MQPLSDLVRKGTPIDTYLTPDGEVFVKREDQATPTPGPPFAKTRGLAAHIQARPERIIGVLDTVHSYGGWAVSYVCSRVGKKAVLFYPRFKADVDLRIQQRLAHELGATLEPLQAGRSAILYHRAKKMLVERYGANTYMIPNALKMTESVTETAEEVLTVPEGLLAGSWVVSVSSGTLASGVVRGLNQRGALDRVDLYLHMGYSRSQDTVLRYVSRMSGCTLDPNRVKVIDEGYAYRDHIHVFPGFPCNGYYDGKAWLWLLKHRGELRDPVVFWNIGGEHEDAGGTQH